MVAGLPKVMLTCVTSLGRHAVQRFLALLLWAILMVHHRCSPLSACNSSCLSATRFRRCCAFFFPGHIHYLSPYKIESNQAALDDALHLFLSGRLEAYLHVGTEKDLGVILNDLSTHELSFQSRHNQAPRKVQVISTPSVKNHNHLLTVLSL